MLRRLAMMTAISALAFTPAAAQEPRADGDDRTIGSFEELPERIRAGQTVFVTDGLDRQTEGRLVRLSDASITLVVQGIEREFPRAEVHQVSRRGDTVGDGAVIGLGVFGAWALASVAFGGGCEEAGAGPCLAAAGVMGGIGAGVGALIDYSIKGKTVVYRTKPVAVTATPLLLRRGAGVSVALRF